MGEAMSGEAIYDTFTRGSLANLQHGSDGLQGVAVNYQSRDASLQALTTAMQAVWQGQAAESASQESQTLVTTHGAASPQLKKLAESMAKQAAAFEKAKNSVVPIPPMPSEPGVWANVQYPIMSNEGYERAIRARDRAIGNNVSVMAEYEEATRQNLSMLNEIPGGLNPNPPQPQPSPEPSPILRPLPWQLPPGASGGTGGTWSGGRPAPNPNPSQQSNPGGFTPQPAPTGFGSPGLTHTDSAQFLPSTPGSYIAISNPSQLPPSSGMGPVAGGFGPLGGGYGSGADAGRAGGAAGPRGDGVGGPGGSDARSGRGGVGARGPLGAEGAAGRGAATSAAAGRGGGSGGTPPMGSGARGQGEDDIERERPSFLIEPDPEETFGTDQMTAPPVIGG